MRIAKLRHVCTIAKACALEHPHSDTCMHSHGNKQACVGVYLVIQQGLVVVCVALLLPVLAQVEDNEAAVVTCAKKARDFADVIRVQ
jgi:hypothetical protein